MRPSTASVAAISGLATVVAADALPIDSIPFSCIRICGPVVELTNICNLGPMANARLLARRDATIPKSQQPKQRGAKNARYRRERAKKGKRGGFQVLIPPPTTFPPGPATPPEPTAVGPGPGPDGGPKEPPAPPPGGPQPPRPPPTQDAEKGPGGPGPGPGPEPKPKPPHEHDDEAETTNPPPAPEPSAPEAVIEIPSSSFATTTKPHSTSSSTEQTHTSSATEDKVEVKPSPSEPSESVRGKAPKSTAPKESDVATDASDDDDDDIDDDGEEFDDADNSNGEWDLKGMEESCVCQNDSFDVAFISAMCASCVDQAGDLQNNINLILHTCNFPKKEYTAKEERAADGIRVQAERPSLPLNAAINVEQDDGAGRVNAGRMVASAAAVAVISGVWCLF